MVPSPEGQEERELSGRQPARLEAVVRLESCVTLQPSLGGRETGFSPDAMESR